MRHDVVRDEQQHCGRGICAAYEGHDGTCAQASGWDAEDDPTIDDDGRFGYLV